MSDYFYKKGDFWVENGTWWAEREAERWSVGYSLVQVKERGLNWKKISEGKDKEVRICF